MEKRYISGVILVVLSAVIWSSAGVFTRGVSADAWSVIFWRGAAAVALTIGYLVLRGQLRAEIRMMTGPAILATVLMASGTAAFIPAFKLSSVANVALIWAAAPFVTAGLAWGLLGERPTQRVVLASLASLGGVAILGWGSLQSGAIVGDLLAGWMTLMMAGPFIIYRRWPQTPAALPSALSALVLLPFAVLLSDPTAVSGRDLWIIGCFGAVFALASVLMFEGARRIPAAEVALLGALETPLAPVLAFVVLAEVPAPATIAGGFVILLAVVWAQALGFRHVDV
jgi:drug/metabolite transporter (DMT)-like permease